MKKYIAEMLGTMVLVLMGCGTAVSLSCTSANPDLASTVVGTALAFGLSVVAMAYAIGGISGCHINPAITLGCLLSGRISGKDAGMYMLFQVIGAFIGSAILWVLTSNSGLVGTGANACSGRSFRNRSFTGGNSLYLCFCIGSIGYNRCKERSRQLCRTCYRSFFGAGSSRLHSLYGDFG